MAILNLDRSFKLDIKYPLGVKETITFTNNDEVTLTDTYQIVITQPNGVVFDTISEGAVLSKTDNSLIWIVNYEAEEIKVKTYHYEIRNLTQDWIEFNGTFIVTKTL